MKSLIDYLKEGYYDEPDYGYDEPYFRPWLLDDLKAEPRNEFEFSPEDSEEIEIYVKVKGKKIPYFVTKIYLSKNKKDALIDAVPELEEDEKYGPLNGLNVDDVFDDRGKYYGGTEFNDFYKRFYEEWWGHAWDDEPEDTRADDYYDARQ